MKTTISSSFCSFFLLSVCLFECVQSTPATRKKYTVSDGNITCVVMETSIQLNIPYGQNETSSATVNVNGNITSNGTCSNNQGQNMLNIYFFNNQWSLEIEFENTSDSSFYWSNLKLVYIMDKVHFPNVSPVQENQTVSVDTKLPNTTGKAPISGSYQCIGTTIIPLDNNITVTLTDLHYRAFGTDNSTGFTSNNIQHCKSATPLPSTPVGVTVSIGIACAALIVVVIIAYLVADKILARRKLSYD